MPFSPSKTRSTVHALDKRKLHLRAAVAHRLPHRRNFGQGVRALDGLGIFPRKGLYIEDAALAVFAPEHEMRDVVGDQVERLKHGPMLFEKLTKLRFPFGLDPISTQRDSSCHFKTFSIFAKYINAGPAPRFACSKRSNRRQRGALKAIDDSPELIELLASREAEGLRVPAAGRILFLVFALVLVLIDLASSPQPSVSPTLAGLIIATLVFMLGLNVYLWWWLRTHHRVATVGIVGAGCDALFVVVLAVLAQAAGDADGLSPAYVFKTELPIVVALIIVLNGLALRPRYPMIVGVGAAVALTLPLVSSAAASDLRLSDNRLEVYAGNAHDLGHLISTVVMVLGTVVAVAVAARAARLTVRKGVAQEIEHARLQQEQLHLVMREKVQALRGLVAGVCHEINTPLGSVRSGADTLSRVFDKLEAARPDDERSKTRAMRAGRESLSAMQTATARIAELEVSLRRLSHLDEADLQSLQIGPELDAVVAAVRGSLDRMPTIIRTYDDVPALFVNGPEINQALLTIVKNACEAAGADGTVTLRIYQRDGHVHIEVTDTGPGIAPDKINQLFDINFSSKGRRVGIGVGLAAAQNAVQRHSGQLVVNSVPGDGATLVLSLPSEANETPSTRAIESVRQTGKI